MATKKGRLVVEMIHHGALLAVPVRTVTIRDEESIEQEYPAAQVPMTPADGPGGARPDFVDAKYLAESRKIDRNRKLARIASALLPGNETVDGWFAGCETLRQRVEALKDTLQEWQSEHLVAMIRVPKQLSEDDVKGELEPMLPTTAAATEAN